MLVQIGGSWQTAWQQHGVDVAEVGDVLYPQIGHELDAVGGFHHLLAGNAHCFYLQSASAEYVYGCQCLYVFEAIGKKFIYFCHNFNVFYNKK